MTINGMSVARPMQNGAVSRWPLSSDDAPAVVATITDRINATAVTNFFMPYFLSL